MVTIHRFKNFKLNSVSQKQRLFRLLNTSRNLVKSEKSPTEEQMRGSTSVLSYVTVNLLF